MGGGALGVDLGPACFLPRGPCLSEVTGVTSSCLSTKNRRQLNGFSLSDEAPSRLKMDTDCSPLSYQVAFFALGAQSHGAVGRGLWENVGDLKMKALKDVGRLHLPIKTE